MDLRLENENQPGDVIVIGKETSEDMHHGSSTHPRVILSLTQCLPSPFRKRPRCRKQRLGLQRTA
jgi:hypothetical protein